MSSKPSIYRRLYNSLVKGADHTPDSQLIYFWDDIYFDQDEVETEKKSILQIFSDNQMTITFFITLILAPLPLLFNQMGKTIGAVVTTVTLIIVLLISQMANNYKYQKSLDLLELRTKRMKELNFLSSEEFIFDLSENQALINLNNFRKILIDFLGFTRSYLDNVDKYLNNVSEITNRVSTTMSYSNQALENTMGNVGVFQEIKGYTSLTSKGVDNLTEAFDDALGMVKDADVALRSIGKQIQMLALNAGIEASRLEQLGVGFDVVASNLRRLSAHTLDTAGDLRSGLKAINENAKQSLELITGSMDQVQVKLDTSHTDLNSLQEDIIRASKGLNSIHSNQDNLIKSLRQLDTELKKFKY